MNKIDARLGWEPGDDPVVKIVQMIPIWARLLLEYNTRNRNITMRAVDEYRNSVGGKRWELNGSSIVLGYDPDVGFVLLDGQKRLMACVAEQVPFSTVLLVGCPLKVQLTIDQGSIRTNGQQIALLGEKRSNRLASISKRFIEGVEIKNRRMTSLELADILDDYGHVLREVTRWSQYGTGKGRTAPTYAVVARALLCGVSPARLERFCMVFGTGIHEEPGEVSAMLFRRMIERDKEKFSGSGSGILETYCTAQNALIKFISGNRSTKYIRPVQEEVFQLDGEVNPKYRRRLISRY